MKRFLRPARAAAGVAAAILSVSAAAQEVPASPGSASDVWVLVGGGVRSAPDYPGADANIPEFFPVIDVWRGGQLFPYETPDEGLGPRLLGRADGPAVGLTISAAETRSAGDIPGLDKVGFGIEAGGYAQTFLTPGLRARAELRQAVASHESLVGDLMLDALFRGADGRLTATVGPRARWGSAGYNRAFFGVPPEDAAPSGLTAYRPGSGFYALGAIAGAHYFLSDRFGLYGYTQYDRLVGDAADSPIVATGSRDQFTTGLALTYRFRVAR